MWVENKSNGKMEKRNYEQGKTQEYRNVEMLLGNKIAVKLNETVKVKSNLKRLKEVYLRSIDL